MSLIIAESFRRFFELNSSKSKVAKVLLEDQYTTVEFGNYIARRGDMISFLPAGKDHIVNEQTGDWKRENRQIAKAGKLARKLINESDHEYLELKDTDFELFSNLIKADKINDEDCQVKFIEVKGENIRTRYLEDNYSVLYSTGTMGESCMRYDSTQRYLDIYVENPEQVSLLVMTDTDDMTVGRAIVWQTNKGVFMDRVYATDAHQKMFENYAESKNWMYKKYHDNDQNGSIMKDGEEQSCMTLKVSLDNSEFDYYPYMDTLSYLNNDGIISNDSSYNDKELRCTDGTVEGDDDHEGEVYCEISGDWIDEDDSCYIPDYGYVAERYARYDDYSNEWIKYSDSQRLENGKYCHEDDAVETEDGWYHENDLDDFEYINGTYYNRQESCVLDVLTDEYILTDDSVEMYNGGHTHENSRDIVELDEEYGDRQYAKKEECAQCPYNKTWFLITDTTLLYSGVRVSLTYMDDYIAENETEIAVADNQLTLEL